MCRGVPFRISQMYMKHPGWYRTVAEPVDHEAGFRHPFIVDRTDYVSCDSSDDEIDSNRSSHSNSNDNT